MLTIDLRDSGVVRPLIGEGRQEGRQDQIIDLLVEKFGPLPASALERVTTRPRKK